MKPKANLLRFLALAGSSLLAISSTHADTLFWDGADATGAPGGGAGTWDTTLTNWDTTQSADTSTVWDNTNIDPNFVDIAVFGGTAGTVTLGSNISVGGLRFDTTAYNIATTSSYALNFGATNNTILFNNAIAAASITGTVTGTSSNVILSNATGATTAGTLTFNGTSATGWSGTTTIGAGMTLATVSTAALTNKVLSSTTGGITLNGGTIQFTRASNSDIDAINNSAIGVNGGGTFSVTSSSGGASAIETIGTVTVNSGQMNFVQTANNANQLVLGGLSRGASTTSAVTFSSAAFGTAKFVVTGAGGLTAANEIYAPWATTGTTAAAQTDYAVFNASNEVGARGIAASAQSTWSTAHAATSNYTLTNVSGAGASAANGLLSATRIVNTVRNTTASTTATATNGGGAALDYFSIAAGHAFVDGDVVSASGTGGLVVGGGTYYVINSGVGGADRFQLSTTSGGSAVDLSNTTNGVITGGITLSTGNNLETYGILNGNAAALAIGASGTGVLTTPTGGGSLYLTTGSGGIFINAPITNAAGGGAVTVVRNGSTGRLILSGNNTFTGGLVVNGGIAGSALQLSGTQSFTGGITLNGGGIGENSANSTPTTQAATLGSNAITVNGPSHLVVEGTLGTSNTITINPNAVLKLGAANANGTLTVQGVVSGSGVLDVNPNNLNNTTTLALTNTANSFSGNVIYAASNGASTLSVSSIGDSGKVTVGLYANGAVKTFELNSLANADLTFDTRQFELAGPSGGHNLTIDNNSGQAFTINTDLLVSGVGTRTLTLQGAGAGLSTFFGKIANGSLTSLGITKTEAGTWALTNTANTYTGATTITTGTLKATSLADYGVASSIGAATSGAIVLGNTSGATGTLEYTGGGHSSDRQFQIGPISTANGSGAILNNGSGALIFDATTFNTDDPTAGGSSGPRDLTLGGSYAGGVNEIQGDILANTGAPTLRDIAIIKTGAGSWKLSGNNTYTKATSVQAGNLIAGNNAPGIAGAGAFGNATSEVTLGVAGGDNDAGILIGGAFNVGRDIRLLTSNTTDAGARVLTIGGNTAHNSEFSGNIFLGSTNFAGRGVTLTAAENGQVTFSGVVQNPSGMDATAYTVTKSGLGTVVLTNTNTYTGATDVNDGTLLVNGSTAVGSTVGVASGATLGGTGTIGGAVNVTGQLSPGASIESLATGALTMNAGSTFAYEAANNSATGADLLAVNGTISLTDVTLSFDLTTLAALEGGGWTVGDKLTLISYGGTAITSGFVGYVDDTNYNFGSNVWTFNYDDTVAGDNFASDLTGSNYITISAVTIIPEPGAALLGGLGLLILLRRRRA